MKILDRDIIRKFFGTLVFLLALLSIIVIIIDVQQKSPRIESNGYTVSYFLLNFYPYWLVYLVITFMSILVFIAVIYFTSRMANNTEIVAYISSGASFHRFARPYFTAGLVLMLVTLVINHFILPWSNVQKNQLEIYTYSSAKRETFTENKQISAQLNPNEFVFINSYNRQNKRGSGYMYQKFDKNKKLVHQIIGQQVNWNETKKVFEISNFLEKKSEKNNTETLANGSAMQQDFKMIPDELFPNELIGQNKNTPELIRFISNEKAKGNSNINTYLNELYQRTSMPVSVFVLTVLALSISSQKKRGGIGLNLAFGLALACVFVFSFEVLKLVSENNVLPPLFAMWLPNLVFAPLAAYLYIRRANM